MVPSETGYLFLLQGAWPFGVVEAIWAMVAVRRWWLLAKA
jgi:hypothetical protein